MQNHNPHTALKLKYLEPLNRIWNRMSIHLTSKAAVKTGPNSRAKAKPRPIGRPPLNLPDASIQMAKLVRQIRTSRGVSHADILEVINSKARRKSISLVYLRSMISPRSNRFHRRLDPDLFAAYEKALIAHYKLH